MNNLGRAMKFAIVGGVAFVVLSGCGAGDMTNADATIEMDGPPPPELFGTLDHAHHHGTEGPHGGLLIELGRNHQYHAELLADPELEIVRVYFLNESMDNARLAVESITLNLTANDSTTSHRLTEAPCGPHECCFQTTSLEAYRAWTIGGASGKLYATVDGVPFIGRFQRDSPKSARVALDRRVNQ